MKHDSAITSAVIQHLFHDCELPYIIQIKIDNCSTQNKCGLALGEYLKLAKKFDLTIIKYYGPSGHGKGLVDAMRAFEVKTPLRNAVVTHAILNTNHPKTSAICFKHVSKGACKRNTWF